MRKPTREERRILIEKGKTIVLSLLFVCCVLLLGAVLNLFEGQFSIDKILAGNETIVQGEKGETVAKNTVRTFWELSEPETIMMLSGEKRVVISRVNENYGRITETIDMIIKNIYSFGIEKVLSSNEEQWETALKEKGTYVKFFGDRDVSFEENFYGAKESGLKKKLASYSEILIIPNEANDDTVVFVREADGNTVVKFEFSAETEALKKSLKACENSEKGKYAFAFETEYVNKKDGVSLAPMFLIPSDKKMVNNIVADVPQYYKEGFDATKTTGLTSGMISLFGYNLNTVRQYANVDGALIFVGETGTLSISPEGRIEYKALGENEGISFVAANQGNPTTYAVVSGVSQLAEKIFSLCGVTEENNKASLKITDFPFDPESQQCNIEMKYFVDGIELEFKNEPALSVVTRNGVMTEFKMWVKSVVKMGETAESENVMNAVESYCRTNPSVKTINSGKLIYQVKEDGDELSAFWKFQGEK